MFEGKPPVSAQADAERSPDSSAISSPDSPQADTSGAELRAVSWSDLVAKLTAARDLRGIFSNDDGEPDILPASFDANSARHLAANHTADHEDGIKGKSKDDRKEGHLGINPSDLGNLKQDTGKSSGDKKLHRPTTRGNT